MVKYIGERFEVYSPKPKDCCYCEIMDLRFPTHKEGKERKGRKEGGGTVGEGGSEKEGESKLRHSHHLPVSAVQ